MTPWWVDAAVWTLAVVCLLLLVGHYVGEGMRLVAARRYAELVEQARDFDEHVDGALLLANRPRWTLHDAIAERMAATVDDEWADYNERGGWSA